MSHISLVVGVLVLAGGVWQQAPPVAAQNSGQLRWVRGAVIDVSPASLTVQLRNKTLTLSLTSDTRVVRPAGDTSTDRPQVGSLIEVHYVDKKPVQRAVLILSGTLGTAKVPRRAGYSYRGVISRTKNRDVYVRVDTKTRVVKMDSKTQLTGVDGQSLAIGWKVATTQLSAGDEVLVTYNQQEDDLLALEIRKIGN